MNTKNIKIATSEDIDKCIAVIVLGFINDPGVRWMYPDPDQYVEYFPQFIRSFAGRAFNNNTAYYVDRYVSSALWLPPGVHPDEDSLITLIENSVSRELRNDVYSLFEQMDSYHPDEPHWHLPLIATDPAQSGLGHGTELLRHILAICDEQEKPAYLESTSVKSIPLYQRYGFEILGNIQVGTSPSIIPMLRTPKK